MSELSKVVGKPIEKEIMGVKCRFPPLSGEDIDLVVELEGMRESSAAERGALLKRIYRKYLDYNFPDATDEERSKVDMAFANEFMMAIYEVNGVDVEELKKDAESTKKPAGPVATQESP